MLLLVFLLITHSAAYSDRNCGSDLNNLWLDVVLLVDNSRAVTHLEKVTENVLEVFENSKIGTRPGNARTTRIALITFNEEAEIIGDFTKFQDIGDLNFTIPMSNSDDSHLLKGLEKAETVLKSARNGYKKIILIYTPVIQESEDALEYRLRADGISVIHVNETMMEDEKIIQEKLLQANCFCPNGWSQLRESFSDESSHHLGVCITPAELSAVWRAANASCRHLRKNGYLVNVFDNRKHDFVHELLSADPAFRPPFVYHIGLASSSISGKWNWEQPTNTTSKSLEDWSNWAPGFPLNDSSKTVVTSFEDGWHNVHPMMEARTYVCEVAACDTDNFCGSDDM